MKQSVLALAILVAACTKSEKKPASHDAAAKTPPPVAVDAAPKAIDGPITMVITPAAVIEAGKPAKLGVELVDADGGRVRNLAVMHEKLLHLIIVSKDLAEFAHIHPDRQPDGTLTVEHTFPVGGTYVAFGDFQPEGGTQTVARTEIVVAGNAGPAFDVEKLAAPLPASAAGGKYAVRLATTDPLVPGGDVVLGFTITNDGKPVTDLQPYLGARGHCVIISEDTEGYLHSHPLTEGTPDVRFHTVFPRAGVYRIWTEFRPNGDPLLVSYVVEVKAADAAVAVAPDAGAHGDVPHHHQPEPEPITPPDAAPAAKPTPTPKADASEEQAWLKAKPVFVEHCAECHTADGGKKSAKKLAKFDMTAYPFTGKKASPADMRKVLGLTGGKATMPKGKIGSLSDDELAVIAAWCDAYDAAHP